MAHAENRSNPRYVVDLEAEVTAGSDVVPGRIGNLSLGGAMLTAAPAKALRVGDRVQLTFAVPGLASPLSVTAQVRWISPADPELVGVAFVTGLRARETYALSQYFERLGSRAS
jgi:hypothetical protein